MSIQGRVHRFGSNIYTDAILPARYLNIVDADELATHCLEDIAPSFRESAQPGDIIVAGENSGCGSAREHAPLAIKANGIACVVAHSFARIFFGNAINLALPAVECPDAIDGTMAGDDLEVQLSNGILTNHTRGKTYHFPRYHQMIVDIMDAGGLIAYTRCTM